MRIGWLRRCGRWRRRWASGRRWLLWRVRRVPGVRIGLFFLLMRAMIVLRQGGAGERDKERRQGGGEHSHDATPSSGRTVTTLNMPECMCINR